MVNVTTLTAADGFTHQEPIKIYGACWGIETLFGKLKFFMNVEPFHSNLGSGGEPEIAASLIWMDSHNVCKLKPKAPSLMAAACCEQIASEQQPTSSLTS